MGNQVLAKRSSKFYKGFNEEQLTYLSEKFELLKDDKGYLDKTKISTQYKCSKQIAQKISKLFDLSEDSLENQNTAVDEYQFICSVAGLSNSPISKLSSTIFNIIKKSQEGIDEKALQAFTTTVLEFNRFKESQKQASKVQGGNFISKMNSKKFKNANYDRNKYIDEKQFCDFCLTDKDYKKWMHYMGFITKKQLQNKIELLDNDCDSDIETELYRHTEVTDPEVDKIKMGIQHKRNAEKLTVIKKQEDQGEQAVGDFNWKVQIDKIGFQKPPQFNPSQNLNLQHAFGYRGFDSRNNLHYNTKGKIIYPTASLGVVLDTESGKQEFIFAHNNDVTCLDVVGDMVVSGEMGSKPTILVWGSQKGQDGLLEVNHYLTQGLSDSIGNVTISPSKRYVAASCNNEDHNIVIYDLDVLDRAKKDITSQQTGIVVADKASRQIIVSMKFSQDENTLIVITTSQILLYKFTNQQLKSNRCQFGRYQSSAPLSLCLLQNADQFASGMSNGSIYVWSGTDCVQSLAGHSSPVYALKNRSDKKKGKISLVSGDKDGIIILWNEKLEKQFMFEVPKITDNQTIVGLSTLKESILVGTRGCQIFQIRVDKTQEKQIYTTRMQSHAKNQLKALCVGEIETAYTAGEDKIIFRWKITDKTKTPTMRVTKKHAIQSLDYNISLKILGVGYKNGVVEFLDGQNLKEGIKDPITEFKNPDREVLSLIKFDRQGKFLAICYTTPQFMVVIYDMLKMKKLGKAVVQSKVISLDFSFDSKKIQLNTQSEQYFAFDISDAVLSKNKEPSLFSQIIGQQNMQGLGTEKWNSQTLTMSKTTSGIFTSGITEKDMTCCQVNPDFKKRNCLIVGDKYSHLKLFTFPCLKDPHDQNNEQVFNKYKGHGGQITGIKFSRDQKFVFSIGGQDKTLLIWKYDGEVIQNNMNDPEQFIKDKGQQAALDEFDQEMRKLEQQNQQNHAQHMQKESCFNEFEMIQEDAGEQAMATKPFLGNLFEPSGFTKNQKRDNKLPSQSLKIVQSFGIRTFYLADQIRNQARFNKDGKKVVYPTAALGVETDVSTLKQEFYLGHKQDIVSFAMDPQRQIAATGQMAQLNVTNPRAKIVSIHVWEVQTKKQLKILNGFHTIAVVLLQFSPDSTLLFSVGNDNQNSYAVYNWKAGAILYSGPVSRGKVNGIAWKTNSQFATCGNDHIKFWTKNKSIQGKINQKKSEQMFSIVNSGQIYITGGSSGGLYNWIGGSASKTSAHQGKVQTLAISKGELFSGGDDGTIMIWPLQKNGSIKNASKTLNMREILPRQDRLRQKQFSILSIDFNPSDLNTLLLVTGGCQILTLHKSSKKYERILSGHYNKQLWGLSTSTENDDKFVTTGDDGTIRLWSIKERKMIRRQTLDESIFIRAIDWSPKGDCIIAADSNARLHLISSDLKQIMSDPQGFKTYISEKYASKKYPPWVEQIKISPNGNLIAFGGHNRGKFVQIVKLSNGKLQKINKTFEETSAVLHLDWDKDSSLISSNSQSYDLNFYNLTDIQNPKTKMKLTSASSCRDTDWYTWTRKIGFPVMGIFQGVDYSDVKSVCVDESKQLIAVGYSDQTIRLFKYPAYVPKQICKQFSGHSSFVTRVRFNRQYLVSVGGNDKTILVWKIEGRQLKQSKIRSSEKLGRYQQDQNQSQQLLEEIDVPNGAVIEKQTQQTQPDEFIEVQDLGDEFMAVKPWIGAIREPSYEYPEQTQAPPNVKIELEHVYGYRCKDSRQNIYYYKNNKILYHAAAVIIYHDILKNVQEFNTDHNDDILSIAYHKQKNLVLTGELGPKPLIVLSQNGKSICQWKNAVTKGVLCLSISPSGKKAVCVGMDDDHMVAVIDLSKSSKVLAKQKGGKEIILKCQWVDQSNFVTVGIKHYKYWTLQQGKLKQQKGTGKILCFVSLAIGNGMILTGAQNNTLVSWKGNSQGKTIKFEDTEQQIQQNSTKSDTSKTSVVQCITIRNNYIVVGCKNKKIFILGNSFDLLSVIKLQEQIKNSKNLQMPSECASIRAIDISEDDKTMIVGTLGAEIYQLTFNQKLGKKDVKITKIQELVKGHYSPNNKWTNEVWGLCVDQKSSKFFTCSDDATVRCWDWQKRKLLSCQSLNYGPMPKQGEPKVLQKDKKLNDFVDAAKGRAVALSPDGKQVFVGCRNGVIRIFSLKGCNLSYKNLFRKSTRSISEIKFHNQILVIGSHDAHIYVYDYQDGTVKQKYKALKKHSSYITHLDISRDCSYLQSTCGAYQLLFWDIQTGKQLTGGATMLRDERWATWSSTLGWPVQGIWPKYTDGTFIHSTDRSNTNMIGTTFKQDPTTPYLLALGNNNGKVVIHNFPCKLKGSQGIEGKGHSSHITNVKWTPDDSHILSAGGEDQCIMQWKITKEGNSRAKKR